MILKEKYGLSAHIDRFGTDQKCHDFLIQVKWNGRPKCPKCGNDHMNYYLKTRNIYKCSNRECRKQFSVISGTIFERSRIPLNKWFLAIYLFTTKKKGLSSVQMGKWLEIKQPTVWFMLHRLREALKEENEIILNGIVEADESSVGPKISRDLRLKVAKRIHEAEQESIHGMSDDKKLRLRGYKSKNGRKKGTTKEVLAQLKLEKEAKGERIPYEKSVVILGMIERQGRMVMKVLGTNSKSVNRGNVYPFLKNHITSSSILITDQLNLYDETNRLFAEHQTVNHRIGYVVDGIHTNNIENAWKQLKSSIDGTFVHISYEHFGRYLNENTYRWNRREKSERVLFEDFMPLLVGKKISYEKLINKDINRAAA